MKSAALAAVVVLSASSCGGGDDGVTTVDVLAASSLTDAFEVLADRFEADNPDIEIRLQFGASSSLAELIIDDGPGDVFAAADERTMQRVRDAGGLDGSPDPFATNQLTIVVPSGNPGGVETVADLERSDLVVGVCAPQVPCGRLAESLFDQLDLRVDADSLEPSARSLLTKVELGELDAGVVYRTDALVSGATTDEIEIGADARNRYSIGVVDAENPGARRFVGYVRSDDAQAVLAEFGFGAP